MKIFEHMNKIEIITDEKKWKNFVLNQDHNLFIQSPEYGEFNKSMGDDYFILGMYKNEKLIGGSLVICVHARRGNFLYLPYGPIFNNDVEKSEKKELFKMFTNYLREYAKKNKFLFLRVSPFIKKSEETKEIFKHSGFRDAPMHILAEHTWILNLEKSEEEIMREMKKNHRNLIRRCIKEGVRVEIDTKPESLKKFNNMHDETAKRHKFTRFSKEYIEKEFKALNKSKEVLILTSYLSNGDLDASAIIVYFGNTAVYRHGASYGKNKKIPTSYLLQWEAIKEAKRRGVRWYNFWGIAPDGAPKSHPFKGITHFKKGFGGFGTHMMHCQDLPLSWKYWFNWMIETFRKKRRGF